MRLLADLVLGAVVVALFYATLRVRRRSEGER